MDYRVSVEGQIIPGLLFSNRKAALETVKRLKVKHGIEAKVTTRKPV